MKVGTVVNLEVYVYIIQRPPFEYGNISLLSSKIGIFIDSDYFNLQYRKNFQLQYNFFLYNLHGMTREYFCYAPPPPPPKKM